jgi:multimeric flavodoxin WrbA
MEIAKKVILLIGSPRDEVALSTSISLGKYLLDKINKDRAIACLERVNAFIDSDETMAGLIDLISGASYIIIISPVYADSLPYGVTRALEDLYRLAEKEKLKNKNLLTIVHCGFREVEHDILPTSIFRIFAEKTNMKWLGGFMIAGGMDLVNKKNSKLLKWLSKNVWKSLDIIAGCILRGEEIPEETFALMKKQLLPKWLAARIEEFTWFRRNIRQNKTGKILYNKPYST